MTADSRRVRAALLHGPRALRVEERAAPSPGPGEAVVRVIGSGLCGTDYRIWNGDRPVRYPLVMGHEMVGRVVAAGPGVDNVRAGDKVAVEPNYSCGRCPLCVEGNRNLCLRRVTVGIDEDGGFAEEVRVPARLCWPAPAHLADDALLFAEPLAVVARAVRRGDARPGQSAAVVGAGTLGLLAVQVLRASGLRVLAVGRTERRLEVARKIGAEAVATTQGGGHGEAARAFSGREGVDLVIETAGTAEAVEQAVELARPGGRIVLTGLPHEPSHVHFFPVVRRELAILGSMIYQDEFPEAIRLLATGAVTTGPLLTHRVALDAIASAFEAHRAPESIKVAVFP